MRWDVEELAKKAAGNWQKFDSFAWHRKYDLESPEDWTVVYTHNRDSGLLDQSNAEATAKEMEKFIDGDDPDVVSESHSHWAVGWVDGYSIRVYKNGKITDAFKRYCEIQEALADYPVLDEEDYSRREYEATCENIKSEGERVARRHDIELPEGDDWVGEVFSWFWDHNQRAVENRDDQGGYPSEEELLEAFSALKYDLSENERSEYRMSLPAKDQLLLF